MIREKLIDKGHDKKFPLSGMTYMLTPVIMTLHGVLNGKHRRRLEERFSSEEFVA